MRQLLLILISILGLSGCTAGAGMQATPPAVLTQRADAAPVSQAAEAASVLGDPTVSTGAGGHFLLM